MTLTRKSTADKTSTAAPSATVKPDAPPAPTKADRLLSMLQTRDGVSIEELSTAFGWLQHTTRPAVTGLRKKGHAVTRTEQGSVTVYRIGT